MSIVRRALERLVNNVRDAGLTGLRLTAYDYYVNAIRVSGLSDRTDATNVFEKDWDVLVLLDCTRPEFIAEVEGEYDFLGQGAGTKTHISVGTSSEEWLENTFVDDYADEIAETVYVTANPNSNSTVSASQFLHLDEVWRDGWDPDLETIPARTVTDRAIAAAREHDPERLVLHYMQPHPPFIPNLEIDAMEVTKPGQEGQGSNMRDLVLKDGYELTDLWDAHVENLRYVLDDLETLLTSIDGDRVILSADHGQAFGEWGVYGHPTGVPISALYTVPWVETSARDTGEYEPDVTPAADEEAALEDKLRALGYHE